MEDRSRRLPRIAAAALVIVAAGCDLDNPGVAVVPRELNFPIAAVVAGLPEPSGERPYLLVANSNFDLHFGSGTLQSYDLQAIEDRLAEGACTGLDPATGVCFMDDSESLVVDEVLARSHMDAIALSSAGDRVYLATRSAGGGLNWIGFDAATGSFSCEGAADPQHNQIRRCASLHQSADGRIAAGRGLTLPSDPVAIAVGRLADLDPRRNVAGDFVVVAHRNANASLFIDLHVGADDRAPPQFVDLLGGVPNDIVSAVRDPATNEIWLTSGALVAARQTRDLTSLEVVLPPVEAPTLAPSLAIARRISLVGIDDGLDTRDLAISEDGSERGLWLLARRPEAVIPIDFRIPPRTPGSAPIGRPVAVGFGPSRIEPFRLADRQFLAVSCYDARSLFFLESRLAGQGTADEHIVVDVVATLAGFDGPFEMAIDAPRRRLYLADFRSSRLWVIDVEPLLANRSPIVRARLGRGRAPSVFM